MAAKFFVVSDRAGHVTYKPAEQTIAQNVEAYLSFETPIGQIVLAQADSEEQAKRFVDLMTKARAA